MATPEFGICSGPQRGTLFASADGQPPPERIIDGQRYVLTWGGWEEGIGTGQHYCPRGEPDSTIPGARD